MTDRIIQAPGRTFDRLRPRGVGYAGMVLGWVLSVVVSVSLVLFLASPQGVAVPGNPFARLAEPAAPKFSVAMKTSRTGEGGTKTNGEAQGSPETERALAPLRQALEKPQPAIARINALIALGAILRDYAAKTKTYPSSQMKLVPAAGALAVLKDAEFERNVPTSIINEMQYVSDGRSYKVIVLGSGDCAVVHALRPAMIDPKRSAGDLDCIAYGIWTPAGREF
ncbi:hypothetical protein NKH73_03105 [Mesorhizobium sp. M0938]|uniref:hypothetical protein n=1 Tax=unclassified Mesorhizobium TaxID=325217 RepID=UPI00333DAAFD